MIEDHYYFHKNSRKKKEERRNKLHILFKFNKQQQQQQQQKMSSDVVARKGRHRQRYKNHLRLVSGCIPYRLIKDVEDRIQVLMVSSPNRDDLVFPKGGWEDDETREQAACREALEEAGVIGIIKETPLGDWEFRSKSKEKICSLEGGCKGYMFALEVTEVLETWPEQHNRDRRWLNIDEAFELCRYEWMREALEAFLRVMAVVEPPIARIPAVGAECQVISSSNCCVKASTNSTHPDINVNPIYQFIHLA